MGCPGQCLEGTFLAAIIIAIVVVTSGRRLVVRTAFQQSRRQGDALVCPLDILEHGLDDGRIVIVRRRGRINTTLGHAGLDPILHFFSTPRFHRLQIDTRQHDGIPILLLICMRITSSSSSSSSSGRHACALDLIYRLAYTRMCFGSIAPPSSSPIAKCLKSQALLSLIFYRKLCCRFAPYWTPKWVEEATQRGVKDAHTVG
mmetsp:Transcript_11220/g.20452  ORF Transcript_11220/g.20452 Transcript_11220/m.20452 type:complete len:202 (-) Transcript_11220:69-674(-)